MRFENRLDDGRGTGSDHWPWTRYSRDRPVECTVLPDPALPAPQPLRNTREGEASEESGEKAESCKSRLHRRPALGSRFDDERSVEFARNILTATSDSSPTETSNLVYRPTPKGKSCLTRR
jgi:hypothetical protein